jgi:hypothetical protein
VEVPRLPKLRRCLLGAPEAGAPGSSPHPPVPAPHPCLDLQAPHAPLGVPHCTRPCTHPGPAPLGPRGRRHPPAQAVVLGELPGGVVSTPSATASWAPLASTGARCRVQNSGVQGWGRQLLSSNVGRGAEHLVLRANPLRSPGRKEAGFQSSKGREQWRFRTEMQSGGGIYSSGGGAYLKDMPLCALGHVSIGLWILAPTSEGVT